MLCYGGNTKTLKKLFNEKKIETAEREYLPLIADKESGEVYAVGGVEISDKIKVTENTQKTVYLKIEKK